jgi:hypothetical protein
MLGLYRLGDCSMIPEIMSLARHESALFRATAAWVMGETGDPRFTEVLAVLMRDPNTILRKRAFSALGSIRAAVGKLAQAPCRMGARFAEVETQKGGRRLLLAFASQGKALSSEILPTHFLLWEDGQMVTSYRVTVRPRHETNSVVFIMPLPEDGGPSWSEMALECLPWKRPSDLWASSYYAAGAAEMSMTEDAPLCFQNSPETIAAGFGRAPQRAGNPDLWHAIWSAVEAGTVVGKRHLIVFSDGKTTSGAGHELITAVAAARAGVHVVTAGPDRRVEEFCRKVNGVLCDTSTLVDSYINLQPGFEIVYQPPAPEGRSLRIRLHAPEARGDLTIPVG